MPKVVLDLLLGREVHESQFYEAEPMTFDPLRLVESGAAAAATLGTLVLSIAAHPIDDRLVTVLATLAVIVTASVYALHAVTYDCFRFTGHRHDRKFSYTRSED